MHDDFTFFLTIPVKIEIYFLGLPLEPFLWSYFGTKNIVRHTKDFITIYRGLLHVY